MSIPYDPADLRTLETLASIQRQLADALARLADASARSAAVADQTAWRTDAATLFHAAADAWRRDVAALSGAVEAARDDVGRLRTRLEVLTWRVGG
ncbi:MAG: hypothetical protein ACXWZG_01965 [Microbacterium sp.]